MFKNDKIGGVDLSRHGLPSMKDLRQAQLLAPHFLGTFDPSQYALVTSKRPFNSMSAYEIDPQTMQSMVMSGPAAAIWGVTSAIK